MIIDMITHTNQNSKLSNKYDDLFLHIKTKNNKYIYAGKKKKK